MSEKENNNLPGFSKLSNEEIFQCLDFAWRTWLEHRPNGRKPLDVWYHILQGKLAELTICKHCQIFNLKINRQPNFHKFSEMSRSEIENAIADVVIENRKKEIKSTKEKHHYLVLSTSYFIDDKYKYGEPDDLIFVNMGLYSLPKTQDSFFTAVIKEKTENQYTLESLFKQKYQTSINSVLDRFKLSHTEFSTDPLVRILLKSDELAKEKGEEIATQEGDYYIKGEISVDDFCKYARVIPPGYVLNLPDDPKFIIFLKEFLALGFPIYEEDKGEWVPIPNHKLSVSHFGSFVAKHYRLNVNSDNMILIKEKSFVISSFELKSINSPLSYINNLIKKYG